LNHALGACVRSELAKPDQEKPHPAPPSARSGQTEHVGRALRRSINYSDSCRRRSMPSPGSITGVVRTSKRSDKPESRTTW
jgi:hypothetical protein